MIDTTTRAATIEIRMMPPPEANPNDHGNRTRAKRKAIREWREEAGKAVMVTVLQDFDRFMWITSATEIIVDWEIAWCCGRRRLDDDNAIAACKPARDGIADAFGVDDKRFRTGTMTQTRGAGIVTVTLRDGTP
jgi:hypothetical protein